MPGDNPGDTLEELMRIHRFILEDEKTAVHFDKDVLQALIEQTLKTKVQTKFPKTGRRAAIEAQKARKKNAET